MKSRIIEITKLLSYVDISLSLNFNKMNLILIVLFIVPLAIAKKCPGGEYQCPDTATCCETPNKSYGCCPLQNAVCCDDHIHCCPEHSKCDAGMCIQETNLNDTAYRLTSKVQDHPCPTEESSCQENYTCCSDPQAGIFGCCPLPDAVCCTDALHCCPSGLVCDLVSDRCLVRSNLSEDETVVTNPFTAIVMKAKSVTSVICPGGEFQCPDDYTCCKLPGGSYGCCPFVNATCCSDHLHCCPQNLKCDATSKSCMQGSVNVTWSLNKRAMKVLSKHDVICPDQKLCPENTTCCQLESGRYGCCAYADGVCCSDHLHCCPSGYDCDVHKRQCVHSHHSLQKVLPTDETNYI